MDVTNKVQRKNMGRETYVEEMMEAIGREMEKGNEERAHRLAEQLAFELDL